MEQSEGEWQRMEESTLTSRHRSCEAGEREGGT